MSDDYMHIQELKLSRAFACEFENFWRDNQENVTPELLKAYMLLKQHYQLEIEKGLS